MSDLKYGTGVVGASTSDCIQSLLDPQHPVMSPEPTRTDFRAEPEVGRGLISEQSQKQAEYNWTSPKPKRKKKAGEAEDNSVCGRGGEHICLPGIQPPEFDPSTTWGFLEPARGDP